MAYCEAAGIAQGHAAGKSPSESPLQLNVHSSTHAAPCLCTMRMRHTFRWPREGDFLVLRLRARWGFAERRVMMRSAEG